MRKGQQLAGRCATPFPSQKSPTLCKGKRLVAAILCAAFLCTPLTPSLTTPALAVETPFPAVNTYAGFTDVAQGEWYYDAVKLCNETGLMDGTGNNAFSPNGTLTVGEVAALAARLLEGLGGGAIVKATSLPGENRLWYQDYVDYLTRAMEGLSGDWSNQKDLLTHPAEPVSRYGFLSLLDLASGQKTDLLPAINAIQTLPDSDDATVLRFYNAGILTGTDAYGTFNAKNTLTRAEAATMLARIVDPAQRKQFTPQVTTGPEKKPTLSYEEEFLQTEALRVNGISVNFAAYEDLLCRMILQYDQAYGFTLSNADWNYHEEGQLSLSEGFKLAAAELCVRSVVQETMANVMGVSVDRLASALTPDPSQEILNAYVQANDLLAAKHILIKTVDNNGNPLGNEAEAKATAESIIAALNQIPTLQQFENLLALYNEDPGMNQYPEGYLFTAKEMVSEFENAVRALPLLGFTQTPVKSTYGYHIILRLDPTTLSQARTGYQNYVLDQLTDQWAASATVTQNEVEIGRLDAKAVYIAFFQNILSSL